MIVGNEPQSFELPIAYNDSPGEWTIRAVDLYTNSGISKGLKVKDSPQK